jgi:hypothetical protein
MTSVEWLYNKLSTCTSDEMVGNINNWFVQAGEMHRQEILNSFTAGAEDGYYGLWDRNKEQYYEETFKKD